MSTTASNIEQTPVTLAISPQSDKVCAVYQSELPVGWFSHAEHTLDVITLQDNYELGEVAHSVQLPVMYTDGMHTDAESLVLLAHTLTEAEKSYITIPFSGAPLAETAPAENEHISTKQVYKKVPYQFEFPHSICAYRSYGAKQYEITDHLGNVAITISDNKMGIDTDNDDVIDFFEAEVLSASDYYPFGSPMPSRTFTGNGYRYGFNGQEKENEIYGEGNTYSAEYWMYDSRLGRRWNLDPVDQISISNYATFANNPIANVDPKGDKYIAKSKSDQNTTMSYLNSVLGEGHGYKFNKKGELKYSRLRDRNKRNYTEDQLFIHEGLKEVVKNKDRIIEGKFYDSNADVKVDFKALDIVTDASGRIMMNNGEPVLELQTVETVEITNAASGGGGVFVNSFDATGNPYDNAALFVFQLDAVEATYESDDESRYQFNNAAPVFFHELLDHGL